VDSKRIKWNSLFWWGTALTASYEQAKRVVLMNQLGLFFSLIALGYVFLFFLLNATVLVFILSLNAILYFVCLVLNKHGYFRVARLIFVSNIALAIYLGTAILGRQIPGQFFLVFLFPLANILFDKTQKFLKAYCLLLPVVAFSVLEVTDYSFFYQVVLPEAALRSLSISVFVVIGVVLYFIFQFYIQISHHLKESLYQVLKIYSLTERELEIISILVKGHSNREIAKQLFIEEATVKNYLTSIFRKLKLKNRAELIVLCSGNL